MVFPGNDEQPTEPQATLDAATPNGWSNKKKWIVGGIAAVLLIAIINASSSGNSENNSGGSAGGTSKQSTSTGSEKSVSQAAPTTTTPPTTLPPTTTAPEPEASYPYAQLIKEADGPLMMKPTTGTACIFQFDASTGNDAFLGELTNDGYGYWSDVAEFSLDSASVGNGFYQGDIVQYHGFVFGTDTYDTRAGGSNTVPIISVTSMTKTGSGCN